MRRAFEYAAAHLALCKELADHLVDRDRPRFLARALVNHLMGDVKIKDFQKATEATRIVVLKLCADQQHAQIIECLRFLLAPKCTDKERKDIPTKRLKKALATQFRLFRTSRFPSPEHFAKEAVYSMPPWLMERMKTKRGDTKKLAGRLFDYLDAIPGSQPKSAQCQRYLRANAFRSKSA